MQALTHKQLLHALQLIITEKGITQNELAQKTGFKQGNISRMLHAKYAPELDGFLALVQAAGTTLAELELRCNELIFSTNRPRKSGYYFVKWQPHEKPVKVWINYITSLDLGEAWTWGWSPEDDPEDLELDIAEPEKIQFAEII